jgi:hypothetical protein
MTSRRLGWKGTGVKAGRRGCLLYMLIRTILVVFDHLYIYCYKQCDLLVPRLRTNLPSSSVSHSPAARPFLTVVV